MNWNSNRRRWFVRRISLFCIIALMAQSVPSPLVPEPTLVKAQAVEGVRSNHATQIKVTGPSGVRVNTWTGNLFFPLPLLSIPGRKLPIQLSLSYNSSWRDYSNRYGYGWQFSYNIFCLQDADGNVTVYWEDGRSDKYIKDGDHFLSPRDVYGNLIKNQSGNFRVHSKDEMDYYFDGSLGQLTKIREPNGNTLTFDYLLSDVYDPNSSTLAHLPFLYTVTDSGGRKVQFSYLADGKLAKITDKSSSPTRTISLAYDNNGNLNNVIDFAGGITSFGYDAQHFLKTITPPVGIPTTITYTEAAVTQVSGELTTKSFAYDTAKHITTMTDSAPEGGQVTRFYYDYEGRISSIKDPLDHTTSMVWDYNNNLTSFTDALNRTTKYGYDIYGNLLSVTDPLNHLSTYTYDPIHHRLTSMTDALGHLTTYGYDSIGNLVSDTDPLNHTTSYSYNSNGDVVARTDANGQITSYQYNSYGDLIHVIEPSSNTTAYAYDTIGNLTGMTNANVNMLYTYDSLNQIKNTNVTTYGKAMAYTYDAFGNRTSMTDPDGGVTTYIYDSANRLISLTNPLSQRTTFVYDSRGRLTRKNLANGTYALYSYDRANHLLSLVNKKSNGAVISSYTYEYDAVGNRTKMTEADGGITTYTYDDLNQLTKVVYPDSTFQEFTYDAVGNRTALKDASGTTTYSYDNANRLLSAGTTTYGWDNNGNQITKTEGANTTTYSYDFENRLTSIALPSGGTNTFAYYPDGRRLSKTEGGGQTTRYFYDGANAIIETNNGGTTTARYTSGLGIDEWISMDRGGSSYFYNKDGLGSVTGLTNSVGSEVATYEYEAFGLISNQTGVIVNPYQFTGREQETEEGLYYYRTRYYDAQIGQFILKDYFSGLQELPLTLNRYRYVSNNPANLSDPYGQLGLGEVIVGILIAGGTIVGALAINNFIKSLQRLQDQATNHWGEGGRDVVASPLSSAILKGAEAGCLPGTTCGGLVPTSLHDLAMSAIPSILSAAGSNTSSPNGGSGPGPGPVPESRPIDGIPSYFLGKQEPKPKPDPKLQAQNLVSLDDILPQIGPLNTVANIYTPTLALTFNDVTSARVVDFVQGSTGLIKSAFLGIETQNTTYEHDYTVCRRFQNFTMDTAVPVLIPGPSGEQAWFWHSTNYNGEFIEEAFTFTVFVKESTKTFTIDSRWTYEDYQQSLPAHDYVFNIRIWAPNVLDAYGLVRETLANLKSFGGGSWNLIFANTIQPQAPSVFIESGRQVGDEIHLTMRSWLSAPTTITFHGGWRSYLDRATNIDFIQSISVPPGVSTVVLSFPHLLDAVVYADNGSFTDKVYVGSGFWFVFDDSNQSWTASDVTQVIGQCTAPKGMGNDALVIPGCSGMTGTITSTQGYVGLGVTINPNGLPVDVSKYAALTFRARGDGRSYHLKIETASVQDGDFHEIVITPPNGTWRQYVIPFFEFQQRIGTTPVPFTGTDVKSIVWVAEGTIPNTSVDLQIDQVGFFNSVIISNVNGPTSTNNVKGPYPITAQITDDGSIVTKTLRYSINGSNTFSSLAMNAVGGGVYKAQIPGRPINTDVRYYIEAVDNEGNKATSPPDAPWATYHFRVERNPSLLVDDFSDLSLPNQLRGDSGVSVQGGTGNVSFSNGEMCFAYNVTSPNGWVVYYSLLKRLDITSFRSVSFDIRGLTGGEIAKFGLNDGHGHEPKLEINEHLPNGITTQRQKVTIPLLAFTKVITDTSQMHSISLAFEDSIGSGQGTVCLDNIRFEPYNITLPLDNFNDQDYQNGVGLNHSIDVGGGGTINAYHDLSNPYGGTGASLALDFSVPASGFAAWQSGLDNDLSNYDRLSFAVRGKIGSETFHVWLVDGANHNALVNITDYTTITSDWKEVQIPLQDFAVQGVDLSDLALFKVAFEWVDMSGTIYLDDVHFKLRPAPVVLSITRADPSPTNITSVNFNVTFSETLAGVDASDFKLNTNLFGASILGVSGSGNTYTVTVNTGSGNGTLRLDVIDNDSIINASNTPLGGKDLGNGNFTTGEAYTVLKSAPPAPVLLSPKNNYITNLTTPTFSWVKTPFADHYEICFASDVKFTLNVDCHLVTGTTFTPSVPFTDGTYYWRVSAYNFFNQFSKPSASRVFTIDTTPPSVPVLTSPLNGASVHNPIKFMWSRVGDAVRYEFQVDTDIGFSPPLVMDVFTRSNFYYSPALTVGTTYYWHVRAQDAAGNWSNWSTPFTVTIVH